MPVFSGEWREKYEKYYFWKLFLIVYSVEYKHIICKRWEYEKWFIKKLFSGMRLLQNKFENKGVLLLKILIFALHSLSYKGKGRDYE